MELSDAAVVAQVLAGDRDAFRLLVDRHGRTLFRLAYRMTGNEQDSEEIVQETFLRAYKALDKFEMRANFGTWIYRIAVNRALDLLNARKTQMQNRETYQIADEPDPENSREVQVQAPSQTISPVTTLAIRPDRSNASQRPESTALPSIGIASSMSRSTRPAAPNSSMSSPTSARI